MVDLPEPLWPAKMIASGFFVLVGKDWRIQPAADIEAGWLSEANTVTISDGEREAVFVPNIIWRE